MKYQVNNDGPALAIHRDRIFIIPFSQHFCGTDASHLFNGTIPGYHHTMDIDRKRGIGQEVDDVRFPALMVSDTRLCPFFLDCQVDLVRKLSEL